MRQIIGSLDRNNWEIGLDEENYYRKGLTYLNQKDIEGYNCYLFSEWDKYEDGYRVVLSNEGEVLFDIYFSGNGSYPNTYENKYAGEFTFEKVKSLSDFEKLKDDKYYFVRQDA